MQHTAAKQLNAVAQAAASGQRWMQQREDKREWLRLLMRLWREVVECGLRPLVAAPGMIQPGSGYVTLALKQDLADEQI